MSQRGWSARQVAVAAAVGGGVHVAECKSTGLRTVTPAVQKAWVAAAIDVAASGGKPISGAVRRSRT